jgi:hypothetical protein
MKRVHFSLGLMLAGVASVLRAHPNLQDAMWVQYEPGLVAVAVNVSLTELAVAHAVAPAANAHGETPELRRAAEQHRDYLLAHLVLRADQRLLTGRAITLTAPATFGQPDATFYQYNLLYILPEPRPAKLEISHQMLREGDYAAGTPWDITYVVRSMRSESPDVSLFLLSRDRPHSIDTGWSEPVRAIAGPTDGGSSRVAAISSRVTTTCCS